MTHEADQFARYHRQMLLPGIGADGQAQLAAGHVLIVGCGALGSASADALARAGVGTITIVDRDIVELTNLQRQMLYTEDDAQTGRPKAIAAERALRAINSAIDIRAHVDDFNAGNAARYVQRADVIVDGLDNFETRYLLNDLAVQTSKPYVYGGAVATTGMGLVVLPRPAEDEKVDHASMHEPGRIAWSAADATPCLRCVFPEPPPPGMSATCDTAGVLGPVVTIIAAWQATQTIKLLAGQLDAIDRAMLSIDVWSNQWRTFDVAGAGPARTCPCCGQRTFTYLSSSRGSRATTMCGRDAVQVLPSTPDISTSASDSAAPSVAHSALDLHALASRLAAHGSFHVNEHLLRGTLADETSDARSGSDGEPGIELTIFPNGRAIIKGTSDPARARSLYARYIGL